MADTILDIPLGRGLAEGFNQKLLPFGAAAKLVNYEVTETGAYTKRRGWNGQLGSDEISGGGTLSPKKLLTQGQQLLAVDPDDFSDSLTHLYSYSPGLDAWGDLDSLPPWSTRRDSRVRLTSSPITAQILPFGVGDRRFELVVYGYSVTSGTYYRILDTTTGAVVVRDTHLTDSIFSVVASVDGHAWVVYLDSATGNLVARKFNGSTLAQTALNVVAGNLNSFDANRYTIGEFVLTYTLTASPADIVLVRISNASATIAASATYTAGGNVTAPSIAAKQGDGIHVAWIEGGDVKHAIWAETLASGTPTVGPTNIDTTSTTVAFPGVEVTAEGGAIVTYDAEIAAGQVAAACRFVDAAGSMGNRRLLYRCQHITKPRRIGDRVFGAIAVPQQNSANVGSSNTGLCHLGLFCLDETTAARPPLLLGHAVTFTQGDPQGPVKMWPLDSDEERWAFASATRLREAEPTYKPETYVDGVDRIELDLRQGGALHHHAHAAPLTMLGGGLVTSLSHGTIVENGFLQAPEIVSHVDPVGPGPLGAPSGNLYLYRARYEHLDDDGLLHVSPWSDEYEVEVTDAGSAAHTVTLTILCTGATRRARTTLGPDRDVRITIWRSEANGASAAGEVVYYRLTPYDGTTADCPVNDPLSWSVTYADTNTDTVMLALGYGQAQFPVDVLAPVCPPASLDLQVHRGRVWLLSAEDRREVWPSRLLVANEAPAFAPELVLRVADSPSELVALFPCDDKMVLLASDRIFYVAGDGPDDTGQAGTFLGPFQVTAQHGCTDARSIVQTPMGGFFLSAVGFVLLDRALNVSFVGDPVSATLEVYSTCLASHHDPARSRAVWLLANADDETKLVAYDYDHQVWSTLDTDAIDGVEAMALWQNRMVLAWQSNIRQEGGGDHPGWDWSGDLVDVWVPGTYETPWICPGGVGAYQRVKGLFLLAERLGYCELRLDVYLNFDDTTPAQAKIVNLDVDSAVTGLPLVRYVLPKEIQACEAIKIKLTDLQPDEPASEERAGLELLRLALELGPEKGFPRLPATNRGGA
jgi:hypothetical protein